MESIIQKGTLNRVQREPWMQYWRFRRSRSFAVYKLDAMFATWTELDRRLKDVQIRLHDAHNRPDLFALELGRESVKLERECRVALHELLVEYARFKTELKQTDTQSQRIGRG
jgi:hypothetical protein